VSPTLGDPAQSGLVASFNRPDGNVTGSTTIVEHLPQKQLELEFIGTMDLADLVFP